MNELMKLYYAIIDNNEIVKNKSEEKQINEKWSKFSDKCGNLDKDLQWDADDIIGDVCSFYQKEGFETGFRTALSLLLLK